MSTIDNKKKIIINPSFFSPSKSKTLKTKSPKLAASIINPNILKKTLINKIKQHKHKEELQKSSLLSQSNTKRDNDDIGLFTDEFKESIHYLDALSKQKKSNNASHAGRDRDRDTLTKNKTLKNPYLHVNLELPDELRTPLCPSELKFTDNNVSSGIKLKTHSIQQIQQIQQDVPYGCLKNGNKPTYRNWQTTTQKNSSNYDMINNRIGNNNGIETKQHKLTERERKLEMIREKLKFHQQMLKKEKESESALCNDYSNSNRNSNNNQMICGIDLSSTQTPQLICSRPSDIIRPSLLLPKSTDMTGNDISMSIKTPLSEFVEDMKTEPKVMIKKTIKRKYTLGKSAIHKRVGILIKDNQTRKKIIVAQKEMKKKPVNEIKNYLKEHGLIKDGTNATNDILRKIYESSLLSGDIYNNNTEILLHNYVN